MSYHYTTTIVFRYTKKLFINESTMISLTLRVQNKSHGFTISENSDGTVHVICPSADINQDYLETDIAKLILDLPHLIESERKYQESKGQVIRFRVTEEERRKIFEHAENAGKANVSEYIRSTVLGK